MDIQFFRARSCFCSQRSFIPITPSTQLLLMAIHQLSTFMGSATSRSPLVGFGPLSATSFPCRPARNKSASFCNRELRLGLADCPLGTSQLLRDPGCGWPPSQKGGRSVREGPRSSAGVSRPGRTWLLYGGGEACERCRGGILQESAFIHTAW